MEAPAPGEPRRSAVKLMKSVVKEKLFIRKHAKILPIVAVMLMFGLLSIWFTWDLTTRRLSMDALEQARIVAKSINPVRLQSLKGNKDDLTSPDYLRIKDQLTQIRQVNRSCSFLYLMGRKTDGVVFFFADSQPPDSIEYAPPGLVYNEVSDVYLHSFDTGKAFTVGPIKDRWGKLMTSLVPIHDSKTSKLIAVLGMDITVKNWNKEIIQRCFLPAVLTIFTMFFTVFVYKLTQSRHIMNEQHKEIKTLQGIIPICMHCKEIRDDKGYWNKLEKYITEHSDAQFSHGLCEKCKEKYYSEYME